MLNGSYSSNVGNNYLYLHALRNNPEEQTFHLHHGGSLKSGINVLVFIIETAFTVRYESVLNTVQVNFSLQSVKVPLRYFKNYFQFVLLLNC